jgi:hypothetical protein
MTENPVRSRIARVLTACVALLVVGLAVLVRPGSSPASSPVQRSSQVVVIPGFAPNHYPGTRGVPPLPLSAKLLAPYHFSQLAADKVTTAALSPYDTVFLYGIRWHDIPSSGRAAINAFAVTHKVVIWDADDTGPQSYSSFINPFSTSASGEHGQHGASVVSYPAGKNYLASDKPASPYYLDPNVLVKDQHMIAHMSAMQTGTNGWLPALGAANKAIPNGGWVVAWSYGDFGNSTGLAIYSGIDADAMAENADPNYATKELALDLAAPFRQTPAQCAPSCQPPKESQGRTYAACSFASPLPTNPVYGRVPIVLRTSFGAGITAKVLTRAGRMIAHGRETSTNLVRLRLDTTKLRPHQTTRLRAVVYVKGQKACTKKFKLTVG